MKIGYIELTDSITECICRKVKIFLWLQDGLFSFQNNPKDLESQRSRSILKDRSRSLGLFRKAKIGIIAKFHKTDLVI